MKSQQRLAPLLLPVLFLAGACWSRSDKTLLYLADQYLMSNTDSIGSNPVVWIPGTSSVWGYHLGGDDTLVRTNAFAPTVPVHQADSAWIPYPRALERWWFALPHFNSGDFREGEVRFYLQYTMFMHRWQAPPGSMQIDQQSNQGNSTSPQLNSPFTYEIDNCIDTLVGDSVWIRFAASDTDKVGVISNNPPASAFRCYDHNPFFSKVGTIHLLNPWPSKTVWVQVGSDWFPLYHELGKPGWVSRSLWADPRHPQPFSVRFANADPRLSPSAEILDAGGMGAQATQTNFDFTALAAKEAWVLPPMNGLPPSFRTSAPPPKRTLFVKRPPWKDSAVSVVIPGFTDAFATAPSSYCDWFRMVFYEGAVPANIVLLNSQTDTLYGFNGLEVMPNSMSGYSHWISLASVPDGSDALWLNNPGLPIVTTVKPNLQICDVKYLEVTAFDYELPGPYFPFSEKTNSGQLKGMVKATLGVDGLVQFSGTSICNAAETQTNPVACADPANGPNNWFQQNTHNTTGTFRQPLTKNDLNDRYEFKSGAYFPLDTVTWSTFPFNKMALGNNHGFCLHARADFQYMPGLNFTFAGDDDVWGFIDKKMIFDLGGQHAAEAADVNLDRLGLVEGKFYSFDLFYCERHTPGSTISISTSMSFVPPNSGPTTSKSLRTSVPDRLRVVASPQGFWLEGQELSRAQTWEERSLEGRLVARGVVTGERTWIEHRSASHSVSVVYLWNEQGVVAKAILPAVR